MTVAQIRKVCRNYAGKYIDIQRTDFKRLGIFGVWDKPYITMDFEYEATTLAELYKCYKKGEVYKGSKPVYWCHSCVTALAEAEVEYADHTSTSVFVKFPLDDNAKNKLGISGEISAVIWTTTPWTLPANVAIAVNRDYEYSIIKINETENSNLSTGEYIIAAKEMLENLAETFKIAGYDEVKTVKGSELEYLNARHPFYERNSVIVLADYVTLDAGTGLVHTAPGHGQDDYETGLRYNLDILSPVDDNGILRNVGIFDGMNINKANKEIVAYMQKHGSLLAQNDISHSYPHCWRCKKPVIFRATPQWFISMSENSLRERTLDAVKNKVKWIPSWGQNRIQSMIENRPDWCISRQRTWGVPIPIFYCKNCGKYHVDESSIQAVSDLFRAKGSDAWYTTDAGEILPAGTKCKYCGAEEFVKETDIMDVWFDSGTTYASVILDNPEMRWPVDLYLEGTDQYRGWFQSSLLTSIAWKGKAPYKAICTHGWVVDGDGRKQSKSLGNGIEPSEINDKYGADILRLWVASSDYHADIRISNDILKQLSEVYRKVRNTARYILGNLFDFDPNKDMVPVDQLTDLDKWALARFNELIKTATGGYDRFEFHIVYHALHNFCTIDMSNFYLDVIKDRLYVEAPGSLVRRAAQTTIYTILRGLDVILAPLIPFTAEEIWSFLPEDANYDSSSVMFNQMPVCIDNVSDEAFMEKWNRIHMLRDDVLKALESARNAKIIGKSLEAKVVLYVPDDFAAHIDLDETDLATICIVSQVEIRTDGKGSFQGTVPFLSSFSIDVTRASGKPCPRCWTYSDTVGQDERHPTLCTRCAGIIG